MPGMTSEERKSIENGIWLCSNCSIIIDRDEKKYTAQVLRAWKKKHERYIQAEMSGGNTNLDEKDRSAPPTLRTDYANVINSRR